MTDGGLNFSPGGYDRGPRLARRRRPVPRRCAPRWLPPTPADVGLFLSVPGCSFSPPPGCSMAAGRQPGYTAALQSRFPQIRVVEDVLTWAMLADDFRRQCGGDRPCLHLVREDFGSEAANVVARRWSSLHRDGGQAQQVLRPVARSREACASVSCLTICTSILPPAIPSLPSPSAPAWGRAPFAPL